MSEPVPPLSLKRHIVHISGFEPVSPEMLTRRVTSGLSKFGPLWNARAVRSEPALAPDGRKITFDVTADGPGWSTETRYTILRWDEMMAPYVERPWLSRVTSGYRALLEFAWNGTIKRYFGAYVRYGLFVIYPFLVLGLFAIGAIAIGVFAAVLGIPYAAVTAPLLALVAFALLMRFVGNYFYLDFALADWAFAADLARGEAKGFDEVMASFTEEVRAACEDAEADEILLSSISLGAVMLIEALGRALQADPALVQRCGPRLAFLSVGSSILKIGLHPAAEQLRQVVGRVGAEPDLFWVEYQAKVDFINFHKTDPVADLGHAPTGRPIVKAIRMRDMMSDAEYRRAQRNMLLIHRQFVMPNGRRYFYDFYQICFGPLTLRQRVRLGERTTRIFAEDGSLKIDPRVPAAAAGG
ncbi:MAG: hypothetical protein J0H94_19920 [Rhizobiales bacterium]|nr:hypothetical protein [Hyphomicrobiales bacterium]